MNAKPKRFPDSIYSIDLPAGTRDRITALVAKRDDLFTMSDLVRVAVAQYLRFTPTSEFERDVARRKKESGPVYSIRLRFDHREMEITAPLDMTRKEWADLQDALNGTGCFEATIGEQNEEDES